MLMTRRTALSGVSASALALGYPGVLSAGGTDFSRWPAGSSPKDIGNRLAQRFIAAPHANFGRPTPPQSIVYPETCTWYGALIFGRVARNKVLTQKLIA